jgi:hypothetical protein
VRSVLNIEDNRNFREPDLRSLRNSRIVIFAFAGIFVFLLIGCCGFWILFRDEGLNPGFCTLDDEVFQSVSANIDGWVEAFRSPARRNSAGSGELGFSVPSGKHYSASALLWDYWSDTSSPIIYVMIEWNRNERLGRAGYIYSPGHRPDYDMYRFEYLDGDVYCYTRKLWAELTQTP